MFSHLNLFTKMNNQNNCARAHQLNNSTHNKLYDEITQGQGTFPFKIWLGLNFPQSLAQHIMLSTKLT